VFFSELPGGCGAAAGEGCAEESVKGSGAVVQGPVREGTAAVWCADRPAQGVLVGGVTESDEGICHR